MPACPCFHCSVRIRYNIDNGTVVSFFFQFLFIKFHKQIPSFYRIALADMSRKAFSTQLNRVNTDMD